MRFCTMNEKVAKVLSDVNVVKFGKFTLASGLESPIYVDLRILPSYPEAMQIVTEELVKVVKKLKPEVIAGADSRYSIIYCNFLKNKNTHDLCQKKTKNLWKNRDD